MGVDVMIFIVCKWILKGIGEFERYVGMLKMDIGCCMVY